MKHFSLNQKVTMTKEAIENYGKKYDGVILVIDGISKNKNDHMGYDDGLKPQWLYDLKRLDNAEKLQFCLYDWELEKP